MQKSFPDQQEQEYLAHVKQDDGQWKKHHLEDHLNRVAQLAKSFAEAFDASNWRHLAGLWHDLGKYSKEFQKRIGLKSGYDPNAHIETAKRVDHSTAGAQWAEKNFGPLGQCLAYIIAGHHAGLPDGKTNENSCLFKRLEKTIPAYTNAPKNILEYSSSLKVPFSSNDKKGVGFRLSFFLRMVFSTLVDADFLDTEAFMNPKQSDWRGGCPSLAELDRKLSQHLEQLTAGQPSKPINQSRKEILNHCLQSAECSQRLFSLTVPTGGGKTLSSLAFALKHALKHDLQRIIYVIPYTSIIEQNAKVFRDIFGDKAVLEHHSNFNPKEEDHYSRLSAENELLSNVVDWI